MSVVDGPAGTSLGKRMSTLCPIRVHVVEPSVFFVARPTAPLDVDENVAPFDRFVNVSAEPVPAESVRTTFPFVSRNSLTIWLPPLPATLTANPSHALPAGSSNVKSRRPPAATDVPDPSTIISIPATAAVT